jgi:hypothetical protein
VTGGGGDNNKEAGDSNEVLITAVERDFKGEAREAIDHFKKLLKAIFPNHAYPIRHKLWECTMMKNYMTTWAFTRGKKPEGDSTGKAAAPFIKEKVVMSIYSGPTPTCPIASSN